MLGPSTCAVEKRGSSTVNVAASRITSTASRAGRDDPRIELGHPRHGLTRAQLGQRLVKVRLEPLGRHRGAAWELRRVDHAADSRSVLDHVELAVGAQLERLLDLLE